MKNFLIKVLCLSFFINIFFKVGETKALVPHYYLPTEKNLKKESFSIGSYAYQLLFLGQIKDSLTLAQLALKINNSNEKLWLILSEAQTANKLYDDALASLEKAQEINPRISEIYFAKSTLYLRKEKFKKAKIALETGLAIAPNNENAIFQLGNIFLIEKKYLSAINKFNEAIKKKPDFWQAINNIALAYVEKGELDLAISFFERAIAIDENAEPLLGLASCIRIKDINSAILLAKKALIKNPNYVDSQYRKEQLWGENLQELAQKLLSNDQLAQEVKSAKLKIQEFTD